MLRERHLHMAVFPLLELSFFVAALAMVAERPGTAVALALVSALCLNFSLHITYHFYVHHPARSPWLDTAIRRFFSVLMGVPFHFYRTLHINHHIHDNGPGDLTSTWRWEGERPVRRGVLGYTLLWPFERRARNLLAVASSLGYFRDEHRRKMRREFAAIALSVGFLAWLDLSYLAVYYGVFYVGWSLINLHNYGQHLPLAGDLELGNSFYGRLYNRLFVNNGLHYEHHKAPGIPYWGLMDLPAENTPNPWPHTIDPVRFEVVERGGSS